MLMFALRELKYSLRRLGLVIFILTIGFVGPFFSSAVRSSVNEYLESSSRRLLSADISVNALRPLAEEEVERLREVLAPKKLVQEVEFVTMARGNETAALVEVKGVDPTFPVYGEFRLRRSIEAIVEEASTVAADATTLDREEQVAWVFPEVLTQLGLSLGQSIGIGEARFKIEAIVDEAPGASRTAGFAPRIYIARRFIEATGLTTFGSQVQHRAYIGLPSTLSDEEATQKITAAHLGPDIFLRTPTDAVQGFERFFRFFNLYLVALTMIVFVLSWVSAFYVLQLFLQERLKSAAILMINGASRLWAGSLIGLQVFIVSAGAYVVSAAIAWLGVRAAGGASGGGSFLPEGFVLALRPADFGILAASAAISAVAFNGPFFVRLYFLKLQRLLGETSMGEQPLPRAVLYASYGPLLFVFFGLAVWLMNSWGDALRIAGGMALAALIGWAAGRVLFRSFFALVRERPGLTRLVATRLARSRFGMNLCFLALTLVALAFNLVPHLLKSAVSEIQPLQGREVPAFFLFNIPESSLDALQAFARERGIELRHLSPMVLGRLQKVNGRTVLGDRLQRFPVRLSYREARLASETLVDGREFGGRYDPEKNSIAEISVEERFAERNGFRMGDDVEFDVQGLPIIAKITSLRQVRWTSFNPNFFIMFQPGVIDEAPKSWIANVNMDGDANRRAKVQFELSKAFPDISVVDIGRTVSQVVETARDVIGPVTIAAWIAIAMSFLILVGIVHHNLKLREPEVDIEKLLGADIGLIRRLIGWEYAAASAFAWFVGATSAIALTWVVTRYMFQIPFRFEAAAFALSGVATVAAAVTIAWLAANRILNLRGTSTKL